MSSFVSKSRIFDKTFLRIWCGLFAVYPLILLFIFGVKQSQRYIDVIGIQILLYVMLAWGLSILVGSAGLLSLNYVVAYAVGAYSYAFLGVYYSFSPWLLLPMSAIIAGISGVVLGLPSLKFRGDYLALTTLIMTEIFHMVLTRWTFATNGKYGTYISQKLVFLGVNLKSFLRFFHLPSASVYYSIFMYYVLFGLCLLLAWIIVRLRYTSIGNAWKTIRDNQKAFSSFNTTIIFAKLSAFAISSMIAGICGALLVASRGSISPSLFTWRESIIVLSLVILGGMKSLPKIAGSVAIIIGGIEILCQSKIFISFMALSGCSWNIRHRILLDVAVFLVILLRSYSFNNLRHPSPFLDAKK
ncbi:MAG: branched-chain amino acid ABC transporter permease [Candidatus Liberibacter ctenarytainae]|uniref:Branched-chain amino acid ABC transporter permease n=1 Tax=Candidatus Liberibacter ctenarytainae TaxID=2020335 RepID=A0A937AL07_9HYPH|nr:branched-chain amino acid ABC transporter permease [Candidatus Liberibacter ctenarytainae]